jgi:folate-binding protein YgfZ
MIKHSNRLTLLFLHIVKFLKQGRLIGDGLLYYVPEDNKHRVIVESNNLICRSIFRYLGMYKLKSKIQMTYPFNLNTELVVSEKHVPEVLETYKENLLLSTKDPRTSALGTLILHSSVNNSEKTKAEKDLHRLQYDRYRMLHGVTEGSELIDRIPIECNLDLLNYISFTKGCYVGQELTARTKFKV